MNQRKIRIAGTAPRKEPRYFRQKATIACNAGRRRRTQMSDAEGDATGAWKMLGKRWALPILKIIGSREAMRFCEIKALLGVSGTMLSKRLLELVREGFVEKRITIQRWNTARLPVLENLTRYW